LSKNAIGLLAVFFLGAGIGIFSFTATALEIRWLYTESDFKQSLAQQKIQDLADICGAIGEREWAEDDKSFKRLRGWGNHELRSTYAVNILREMKLEKRLIESIEAECATRLSQT